MKLKHTLKVTLFFLLGAVFIPLSAQTNTDPEGVTIRKRKAADSVRVLTANIRFPLDRDNGSGDEWSVRKDLCCEVLAAQDADIICIQEGRQAHLPALGKTFRNFEYYDFQMPSDEEGRTKLEPANAIFWRSDRFEKLDGGGYWLSPTPEITRSKFKESASTRYVTWVLLKDRNAGRELMVWNTHLDHKHEEGRFLQGGALVNLAALKQPFGTPRILTGDFNTNISKTTIPHIKKNGWIDSYETLHGPKDPGATFHSFLGADEPKHAVRGKIDFVFHNDKFKAIDAEIVKDRRNGRYPSDHYFVIGELEYVKEAK